MHLDYSSWSDKLPDVIEVIVSHNAKPDWGPDFRDLDFISAAFSGEAYLSDELCSNFWGILLINSCKQLRVIATGLQFTNVQTHQHGIPVSVIHNNYEHSAVTAVREICTGMQEFTLMSCMLVMQDIRLETLRP